MFRHAMLRLIDFAAAEFFAAAIRPVYLFIDVTFAAFCYCRHAAIDTASFLLLCHATFRHALIDYF